MTKLFQATGFRSPSSIAAISLFLLWHIGIGLLCSSASGALNLADTGALLCISSVLLVVILVPVAFIYSLLTRFRFAERRFDYFGPTLALVTFMTMFLETAANAPAFAVVPW